MQKSLVNKIAVFTSGGDAPGMNAALRAVVRTASHYNIECYGVREGFNGLIHDDFTKMGPRSVKNIITEGGTILKSARSKEFMTKEGRKKAYDNCVKHGIEALVCIGGDGTFTGAKVFNEEFDIKVIGVPGTIDNDIFGTDNTIGYDTALNTAMEAIDKIRDTATSHNRVFFVEVMGRDAGFIALNSGLATGALDILIPERKDSIEDLFATFERAEKAGKSSSIVVVAEGEQLGSIYDIAKATKAGFPDYDIRVAILGHIQRGGTPTAADRMVATRMGFHAVQCILNHTHNVMVGIVNDQMLFTPLDAAVKSKQTVSEEWINIADILG